MKEFYSQNYSYTLGNVLHVSKYKLHDSHIKTKLVNHYGLEKN